jgi:hypothetical protein
MDIPAIKDAFYMHSGLNQWAETNNVRCAPSSTLTLSSHALPHHHHDHRQMIVLYPQAIVSSVIPYNPNACWDWCVDSRSYAVPPASWRLDTDLHFLSSSPMLLARHKTRWGYTGTAYASQGGYQMAAIKRMISALTQH